MALILSVTPAGRAALRNAKGDGTNAVRIDKVGITATPFISGSPVPNEIKRLSTIAGGATAADTIHVTISDSGSDVYSVFGFGFYLADGTLFASYGQPGVILQKSAQSMMQLATDVQFADVAASSITFGDTNFNNPAATTDTPGVVELATDPETALGNDRQRAITPAALRALLDSRFGAGAPSDYIKSLLTAATAVVLWQALGLKSAAGYDTGAGKGLDADKLDGQDGSYYLDYNHLQNVPPPVEQSHSADDITSGTLAVVRGGTGANTLPAGGYLVGNGTGAVQTKTASAVLADIGAAAKVHTHQMADIIGLANALAALAPLSSPALTGTPTAPTAANTSNSTQVATTAFVQSVIAALIDNSPAALNTLKELADALGDDPNFATTVTNLISTKVSKAGDTMTGALTISPSTTAATITLNRPTPAASLVLYGQTNGSNRWAVVPGMGGTEPGGGVGSDFGIYRYGDNGVFVESAVTIRRSDGLVSIGPTGGAVIGGYWNFTPSGTVNGTAGAQINVTQKATSGPFRAVYPDASGGNPGIGGSYTQWNGSRIPALQVDTQNDGSAYMIWRATNWGHYHVAAMDTFYNGGTPVLDMHIGGTQSAFRFFQYGNMTALGMVTAIGGFNSGSSIKIKADLKPNPYGLDHVRRIETRRGRFRKRVSADQRKRLFVVAEQLLDVIPEPVTVGEGKTPTTVDYSQLIPVLIEAVKDLANLADAQAQRLSLLEGRFA